MICPIDERVSDPSGANSLYVRDLTPIAANRLRLDLCKTPIQPKHARQKLGYAILQRANPTAAFHIIQRHPLGDLAPEQLVTFCDRVAADEAFLRKGCDFYY